jgi:hypothetical protein
MTVNAAQKQLQIWLAKIYTNVLSVVNYTDAPIHITVISAPANNQFRIRF